MGNLYVIGTPIGNLEDITLRGLRVLKEVDFILCEDTRVTARLLNRYEIKTPTISYHQHSRIEKTERIISLLKSGKKLALVSDAGTPGISDPGGLLIETIIRELEKQVNIIAIPGPSAVISALSVCGFCADKFIFYGFPPTKSKRNKFFKEIMESKHTAVFYESSHRILKALEEVSLIDKERSIVVCQELTKIFEKTHRGTAQSVLEFFKLEKEGGAALRGEFVVIVSSQESNKEEMHQ